MAGQYAVVAGIRLVKIWLVAMNSRVISATHHLKMRLFLGVATLIVGRWMRAFAIHRLRLLRLCLGLLYILPELQRRKIWRNKPDALKMFHVKHFCYRHPCEGRGPHDYIRIKNLEIRIKSFSFLNSNLLILSSTLWIPAFAGMTAVG